MFLRMYVDIDGLGINGEVDEVVWLFLGRYQLLIACHHGLMEIRVSHVPSVHHEVLQCAAFTGVFRS